MNPAANDMHAAVAAVAQAWTAAASPWNADALTDLFTADALFFGGKPEHSVGAPAIRDYFASYQGVILSAALRLVEQQVLQLQPGCLLAQGYGDFSFLLAGDRATRSRVRTSLLLVLQDGRWKIRQHHFSPAPSAPPLGDQ